MLTETDIEDTLSRISYRPGYTFLLFRDAWEGLLLRIVVDTTNAYRDEPLQLRIDSYLPPFGTIDDLFTWLIWRIVRIESHEAREWLRYDGRQIANPHR